MEIQSVIVMLCLATMPIWLVGALMFGDKTHDGKDMGVEYIKDNTGLNNVANHKTSQAKTGYENENAIWHDYRSGYISKDRLNELIAKFRARN